VPVPACITQTAPGSLSHLRYSRASPRGQGGCRPHADPLSLGPEGVSGVQRGGLGRHGVTGLKRGDLSAFLSAAGQGAEARGCPSQGLRGVEGENSRGLNRSQKHTQVCSQAWSHTQPLQTPPGTGRSGQGTQRGQSPAAVTPSPPKISGGAQAGLSCLQGQIRSQGGNSPLLWLTGAVTAS